MPVLLGIAVKPAKKAPMKDLRHTELTMTGLAGHYREYRQGARRAVTVLSYEQWQEVVRETEERELSWHTRRANLLVSGVVFGPQDTGKLIRIGGDVVLQITGPCDPCERMDEAVAGL